MLNLSKLKALADSKSNLFQMMKNIQGASRKTHASKCLRERGGIPGTN